MIIDGTAGWTIACRAIGGESTKIEAHASTLRPRIRTGTIAGTSMVIGVAGTDVRNVFKLGRSGTRLKRCVDLETEPQKAA